MRLIIITAALATTLAVTGCAGSTPEQASTPRTSATSEAAAPSPTSTPSPRTEALFLADLAAWPKVDSDTKLAFGNVLCDGLAAG